MAWKDTRAGKLVTSQASFRGAPFNVDTAERQGGRRGVTHEYPFRDEPFHEDLGRQVRKFTVEGHVIGPDYLNARDRLLAALEEFGPGTLVHPYYGTRQVAVTGFRVRESATDGGVARFSADFEETPAKPQEPTAAVDTGTVLTTKAGAARAAVVSEFTSKFFPGVHLQSLQRAVTAVAGKVSEVQSAALSVEVQASAAAAQRSAVLSSQAGALITSAVDLAGALVGLFDAATGLSSAQLLPIYSAYLGPHPSTVTTNRVVEGKNFDALQQLTQRLVVVRAAELALLETFPSFEAATSAQQAIAELLDEQAELAGDTAYTALADLRAALVNAVPGSGSTLPHLVAYTPPETAPSLVLAHRLYGSVVLESDVLARNRIVNPLFVVGGTALEVLSGS